MQGGKYDRKRNENKIVALQQQCMNVKKKERIEMQ